MLASLSGTFGPRVHGGQRASEWMMRDPGRARSVRNFLLSSRSVHLSLSISHYRCLQPIDSFCELLPTSSGFFKGLLIAAKLQPLIKLV